jgi:UDP-N-acetylmuramate--alanine ligase
VLEGFKERFPERRIVTLFQPHRYSRTELCWNDFLDCFANTDVLYLLDIYAAGEASIAGVSSENLVKKIRHNSCTYISRVEDPEMTEILESLRSGDVFLSLGAGDVSKIGARMAETFLQK